MIKITFSFAGIGRQLWGVADAVDGFITTSWNMTGAERDSIQRSSGIIEKNGGGIEIFDAEQALFLLKPYRLRTKAFDRCRNADSKLG
jgi:hypothetical protein